MTLAQLRYLLAIVDAGLNITGAADRVNATQPGLSKQLKHLEEYLGLKLFVRRGRNLERLTPAGEEIVRRARTVVAEADTIRDFAIGQRADQTGPLTIETTHIQALHVLPDALAALRARYPDTDITLGLSADAPDAEQRLRAADLGLFSTGNGRPPGDIVLPLYRWDPVAVVRADHPVLFRPGPVTLAGLAAFPLFSYDHSTVAPLGVTKTFTEAGLSPRFAFTVREADLIKAAVRGSDGIGIIAEMAFDPDADFDLRVVPLARILPRCTAWAVLRRDAVLRAPLVHLLSLLSGLTPLSIRRAVDGDVALETAFATVPHWSEIAGSAIREADEVRLPDRRIPAANGRPVLPPGFTAEAPSLRM